jgi:hypothetical protein
VQKYYEEITIYKFVCPRCGKIRRKGEIEKRNEHCAKCGVECDFTTEKHKIPVGSIYICNLKTHTYTVDNCGMETRIDPHCSYKQQEKCFSEYRICHNQMSPPFRCEYKGKEIKNRSKLKKIKAIGDLEALKEKKEKYDREKNNASS